MRKIYFLLVMVFAYVSVLGQVSLTNGSPSYSQNFDGMAATTTLPTNWRIAASTTSPTWAGASSVVTQQASSGAPTAGGTYNFGTSTSERSVGAMTSGSFASPNSPLVFFNNGGTTNITTLAVSYDAERYRINTAAASIQFFYSLNGTSWTAVSTGDIATSSFPTGASVYTFTTPLTINVSSFNITGLTITPGSNFYLRWNINTIGANSQGIAIDNVNVTATFDIASTPDISLSSPNPAIAAGNVAQGSINNPIYRFDLAVTTANATLNGVTINTSGTYAAADLDNLKCWYSADNSFDAGTDVLLSTKTTSLGAGTHIFPGFTNQVINSASTGYIFITADMDCAATLGNTISVDAITTADISFASGNKSGSAFAGDAQTVVAGTVNNATGAGATNGNAQSSVSWTTPTGCFNEVMIVAAAGAVNSGTPTGDGTAYTANLAYGSGTALGNGFVVYKGASSPQVVTALTNGNTYYFKIFTRLGATWSSGVEVSATPVAVSSATDYFRSAVATGNWNVAGSWESSVDGSSNWIVATLTPTSASSGITIRNGHTITMTATESVDQFTIDAGGQLTVAGGVTWTLADGTGTDLTVNGTLLNQGGSWTISGGATWAVNSGGVYIHNTASGASTPLGAATLDPNSTVIYRGSSSLTPAVSYSGRTYGHLVFESSSGTWSTSPTLSGSLASSCTNYTVGSGVTLTISYTGVFTINGNYINNGSITYSTGTQVYTFTGANNTISGSASITFENLNINSGAQITVNSPITILSTFTGNVNGTLIAAATVTNNGTTNINNIFQLNDGGWGTGTGFVYGPAATLVFNTTTNYGVNNDAYWPSASGPVNVTVQNTGGITMNVTRTVTGLFQTAAGVLNGNNLTLNGTAQLNTGGYFTNAPVYGPASLLRYNTGGTYNRGDEWNATGVGTIGTTNGYPNDVQVSNNTTINFPNGVNVDRACARDLIIDNGSSLYADFGGFSPKLIVGRHFDMSGNVTLGVAIGGDMYVRGNFTRNAGTFNPNGRAVFFDGPSGDQTITGVTTFDYLEVNKAAGNVVLASSISCNQGLTLASGKIVLGANDITLLNGAPSALNAASSSSYVVTNGAGAFRRAINTVFVGQDYFLPVGNIANRQNVTVNFVTISANNTLAARFISGAPAGTAGLPLSESGNNITRAANNGYWEVTAASATTDNYTGTFSANGFTDITDYTRVHLIKRADAVSNWLLNGTHNTTTGSNLAAVLQRTGMSGFSQFAVGGQSNLSLPVTLLSFSGYKDGSRNQLSWTTGTEINNRGFDVQRSADGINYTSIGFVNSLATGGNSNDQLSYRFTDNTPAGVKQYYRLRQEDLDGRSKLSNIIMINGARPTMIALKGIYPNPASATAAMIIDAPVAAKLTVLLTDMAGRNLVQQIVNVSEGSNTVALNIASLQSGTYLVRVISETGEMLTGKLVKQ